MQRSNSSSPKTPSRRNSSSSSSQKRCTKPKSETPSSAPASTHNTPKKSNLDFTVTGKQILMKDVKDSRSLPASVRLGSVDTVLSHAMVLSKTTSAGSSKRSDGSDDDTMSLDISQVTDFEDTNSKYGLKERLPGLATSTPKASPKPFQKPRSSSLQSQKHAARIFKITQESFEGNSRSKKDCCQKMIDVKSTKDSIQSSSSLKGDGKEKDSFSRTLSTCQKTKEVQNVKDSFDSPSTLKCQRSQSDRKTKDSSIKHVKSKEDSFGSSSSCRKMKDVRSTQDSFESSTSKSQRSKSDNAQDSFENSKQHSTYTCSPVSLNKTGSGGSSYRISTEEYSESPEYLGQSSADISPKTSQQTDIAVVSPYSQRSQTSSSFTSWLESNEGERDRTKIEEDRRSDGEWGSFWANYNNSVSWAQMKTYYDQCPTPYRTDLETQAENTDLPQNHSTQTLENMQQVIQNDGLYLTAGETQKIIKCAHMLSNVLSEAIDRNSRERQNILFEKPNILAEKHDEPDEKPNVMAEEAKTTDEMPYIAAVKPNVSNEKPNNKAEGQCSKPEMEIKKKNMTLDLSEEQLSIAVVEEKFKEHATTQTDISLPNTKSAPRIFEKILRQLSRSSFDVEKICEHDKAEVKE